MRSDLGGLPSNLGSIISPVSASLRKKAVCDLSRSNSSICTTMTVPPTSTAGALWWPRGVANVQSVTGKTVNAISKIVNAAMPAIPMRAQIYLTTGFSFK